MVALAEAEPYASSSPLPLAAIPSPVSVSWPRTGYGNEAFTGREWDPETGLYYYRARYYDPKIGRFISEDPIDFEGGVNFYSYVENNPVNLVDPEGLQACLIIGRVPTVIDPYMIGGRHPFAHRFPNQTFNEAPRPVRPTPPRVPTPTRQFSPRQPLPPDLTVTPKSSWWKQFLNDLSDLLDDVFGGAGGTEPDCGCIA
jgi:RHS repeat-associated protein